MRAFVMRISDWSSDVCSSDLRLPVRQETDRLGVLLAQPVIAGMALLPFVTARDPACKADAQRVGERSAQETFQFNRIEPAVGQRSTGRQVAGGLGRDI